MRIRAGLHTGECEVMGAKMSRIAVHVAALADAGEVLVSSTVKDLVAGLHAARLAANPFLDDF